jgi:hypothetical protein
MQFDQSPYFNMTISACHRAGARGGRAHFWNLRLLRSQAAPASERPAPAEKTAAEAIATLDRQFPWLRGAEIRTTPPAVA